MILCLLCLIALLASSLAAATSAIRVTNNESGSQSYWVYRTFRVLKPAEIANYPRPVVDGTPSTQWQADCPWEFPGGYAKACYVFWQTDSLASAAYDDITFQNSTKSCYLADQAACDAAGRTKQEMLDFDTGGGTGSQATTFIPNAAAICAVVLPIWPNPTMPIVSPAHSISGKSQ